MYLYECMCIVNVSDCEENKYIGKGFMLNDAY